MFTGNSKLIQTDLFQLEVPVAFNFVFVLHAQEAVMAGGGGGGCPGFIFSPFPGLKFG